MSAIAKFLVRLYMPLHSVASSVAPSVMGTMENAGPENVGLNSSAGKKTGQGEKSSCPIYFLPVAVVSSAVLFSLSFSGPAFSIAPD